MIRQTFTQQIIVITMKRRQRLFYSRPIPPVNDGLGKATKSLNEAIKELDIALTKLEEVSKLRKEMVKTANQLTTLRESSTSRHSEEEDTSPLRSTPVCTPNAIVPVLITTFFRH